MKHSKFTTVCGSLVIIQSAPFLTVLLCRRLNDAIRITNNSTAHYDAYRVEKLNWHAHVMQIFPAFRYLLYCFSHDVVYKHSSYLSGHKS